MDHPSVSGGAKHRSSRLNPSLPAQPDKGPEGFRIPGARLVWNNARENGRRKPVALAVGMFDGVHLGHQSVIESAVATARHEGGIAAVLTFAPHPSRIFRPENPTRLLMPPVLKQREIFKLGVDLLVTRTFDAAFAQLPGESFLSYLKEVIPTLGSIHVGENFRYGRGRLGDVARMVVDARPLGIDVFSVDRFRFNGEPVSSSRLRAALSEGKIEAVNAMLGYDYYAEGPVVEGRKLGRTIGFPTLNLQWEPELMPRLGVYAVSVTGPDKSAVPAVANYGLRPTVEQSATTPLLEVHLLAEKPWSVGDQLRVYWERFLRPERKFETLDALKAQIGRDRDAAVAHFSN